MIDVSLELPALLSLAFFCALFFTTLSASFLTYHWYAYGEHRTTNHTATLLYLAGCSLALIALGSSAIIAG